MSDNDLKLTLFKVFQGLTYNDTLREMQLVCIADLIIIIFTFWCICLDVNVRLELNITLHRKKGVERHCLSFSRRNLFYGCLIWNKSYFECFRSLLQLNKLHRVIYKPKFLTNLKNHYIKSTYFVASCFRRSLSLF